MENVTYIVADAQKREKFTIRARVYSRETLKKVAEVVEVASPSATSTTSTTFFPYMATIYIMGTFSSAHMTRSGKASHVSE